MGTWIFLALVAIVPAWLYRRYKKAEAADHQAFLDRIAAAEEWVNGLEELPVVEDMRLQLQRGERCHYVGPCEWWELRKQVKRINYAGPVASVQLMRGLRYRVGSITPSIERESTLLQQDVGELYITDKRLFFDGREKNTTIPWKAVAAVAAFKGGFEVERQTGRSPYLKLDAEPERAAAIATRLLAVFRGGM